MTAPDTLDDAQIEQLSQLLDQRAVPFKGFNLEVLDGYLSALAVSPGDVPMAEWEPPIWGSPPHWDDADQRREVEALLRAHAQMAQRRVRHDNDDLPDDLAPLLWLPEAPEAENDDDLDVGRDWALGFFTAVELRELQWDQWLDDNDWIEVIFGLLDRLASGEVLGDDPTAPAEPLAYRERLAIVASLPDMLVDLHDHRIETLTPHKPIRRDPKPDRNALCPCGSGKKYKKCCGA